MLAQDMWAQDMLAWAMLAQDMLAWDCGHKICMGYVGTASGQVGTGYAWDMLGHDMWAWDIWGWNMWIWDM